MQRLFVALITATITSPALAAEVSAACKPVVSAMERTIRSDHITTTSQGGKTTKGITVGGVVYLQLRDKWIVSPMTPQDMQKQSNENLHAAKSYTCEKLADSVIDGVAVSNYRARTEGDAATNDSTISIAKSSGLAVRVDNDIKAGPLKRHSTTDYSYTDVHAPGA